jgi:Secretion system C-terminal sorting domain/AhpC/TSA family
MVTKLGAILIFLAAVLLPVAAQLPPGATAPDFTVQDINGQSHHLYDVLEHDKIVLLEISATWCPPCWVYHQTQALQDFYNEHGPDGDDKARVFWVEGDPATNVNCIFGQSGCNNNSAGNYAANTPYPIINNSEIADNFDINYFPSLFLICPNKRVYEVDPLTADKLWDKAQVCPVANGVHNAGVFNHDPGYDFPEICDGVNLSPSFLLTNLGSAPLTSASILLQWNDAAVQTIEWQGNLPTYGEALISFDPLPVNTAGNLNTVVASINNNVGDVDFTNNYKHNAFSQAEHFNDTRLLLKIRTDDYGAETYWELRDEQGVVLEKGGNQSVGPDGGGAFPLGVPVGPGAYPSNSLIKDTLNLPSGGCYSIHFVDAYGDGMCCEYGNGYYKLYDLDTPTTPLIASGEFEFVDRHAFGAGVISSTKTLDAANFQVQLFPNPVSDVLHIDIQSSENQQIQWQVVNAIGQVVAQQVYSVLPMQSQVLDVPVGHLPNGLYYLRMKDVQNGGGTVVRKFVVQQP